MDCFILEGRKVMYRVWMAILILFSRHLASLTPAARMNELILLYFYVCFYFYRDF